MRITSHECLPDGTTVTVNSLVGVVINAKHVPAHPCGTVALHTIKFTHRKILKRLADGRQVSRLESIKPFQQSVNYAFINYGSAS